MNSWQETLDRINKIAYTNPTWLSFSKSLYEIIQQAEAWNIDPNIAKGANISNLCEIAHEGKIAVTQNDKERLIILFNYANDKTNRELRLTLRGQNRQNIDVYKKGEIKNIIYHLELNEEQYIRISKSTEQFFEFTIFETTNQ